MPRIHRGLTVTSGADERQFNPSLGGQINESDFAGYMSKLGLAHRKLLDMAVPGKLRGGRPEGAVALSDQPSWAPLTFTFAGARSTQAAVLLNRAGFSDVANPPGTAPMAGRGPSCRARTGSLDRARCSMAAC